MVVTTKIKPNLDLCKDQMNKQVWLKVKLKFNSIRNEKRDPNILCTYE
jgi:hypothetical protein